MGEENDQTPEQNQNGHSSQKNMFMQARVDNETVLWKIIRVQ